MTFNIPESLPRELYPLSWLVGSWKGEGVIEYKGEKNPIKAITFEQEISFTVDDGGKYLAYDNKIADPETGEIWSHESGFWMLSQKGLDAALGSVPEVPASPDLADSQAPPAPAPQPTPRTPAVPTPQTFEIEAIIANASGYMTLFVGEIGGGKIEIASDAMARTPHSFPISGSKRMYGLVEGDLLWAEDIIAFDEPLKSYASARLTGL
jgi:hypothetical protein